MNERERERNKHKMKLKEKKCRKPNSHGKTQPPANYNNKLQFNKIP
jgi:hypothetical protein